MESMHTWGVIEDHHHGESSKVYCTMISSYKISQARPMTQLMTLDMPVPFTAQLSVIWQSRSVFESAQVVWLLHFAGTCGVEEVEVSDANSHVMRFLQDLSKWRRIVLSLHILG